MNKFKVIAIFLVLFIVLSIEIGFTQGYLTIDYAKSKSLQINQELIKKAQELKKEGYELYKKKLDLDAIKKYEKALDIYADGELYYFYANSLSNLPELENSIKAYKIALELGYDGKEYLIYYNLACAYSRLNNENNSIENLILSFKNGYINYGQLFNDYDLSYLRNLSSWDSNLQKIIYILLEPTSIKYYKNYNIIEGILKNKLVFKGLIIGGGIGFYPSGRIYYGNVTEDSIFEGYQIRKSNQYAGNGSSIVKLYESGHLKSAKLNQSINKNGGRFYEIELYESGELAGGVIATDTIVRDNITYGQIGCEGDDISFYKNGRVQDGVLCQDIKIQNMNFSCNLNACETNIGFYENGKVKYGYLAKNTTVNGISFASNLERSTFFYENGTVHGATLAGTYTYKKIKLVGFISFYKTGQVETGILAEDTSILINNAKVTLKKGTAISFDKQGNVYGIKFKDHNYAIFNNQKLEVPYYYIHYLDVNKRIGDCLGMSSYYYRNEDYGLDISLDYPSIIWIKFDDYLRIDINLHSDNSKPKEFMVLEPAIINVYERQGWYLNQSNGFNVKSNVWYSNNDLPTTLELSK